ncbi:hypothetical protein NK983_35915, partial [Salmonella enterica subsp. enterica serovar Typhimurium]|nr:hypothetical protein [Salmonella enterica subsp. enterica serovar Typhimurium]
TAQSEQNGHRVSQLEEQVKQLVADAQARAAAPAPAATPTPPAADDASPPAVAGVERPSTGDPAEDGYIYGFRLWQ